MRSRGWRLDWANLLRRVFLAEGLACACGGTRRVIASVEEGPAARKILRHLGLPDALPVLAPARIDQSDFWPTGPPALLDRAAPATDEFDQRAAPASDGELLRASATTSTLPDRPPSPTSAPASVPDRYPFALSDFGAAGLRKRQEMRHELHALIHLSTPVLFLLVASGCAHVPPNTDQAWVGSIPHVMSLEQRDRFFADK